MRGFGVPKWRLPTSQMDQLALQTGLSPVEIRLKNALAVGSLTATGQLLKGSAGLVDTLQSK